MSELRFPVGSTVQVGRVRLKLAIEGVQVGDQGIVVARHQQRLLVRTQRGQFVFEQDDLVEVA